MCHDLDSEQAYLDEILAFRFGDKGLKLRRGEGVDESSLGHDKE